jgi:unsaturated rhamnogalacturonyl hydrolase
MTLAWPGLRRLLRLGTLLDEPRYDAWVHGLLRGWAARRRPFAEIDNTLPGKVLCELADRHGDDLLLEAALDAAGHLASRRTLDGVALAFEEAPLRDPFGGESLTDTDRALIADPGPGVFVDPLHFDPPFLVWLGVLSGSAELTDAGAEQALALVDLLQDPSGAFWHFFLERSGERYGLGWGRGQRSWAWSTWSRACRRRIRCANRCEPRWRGWPTPFGPASATTAPGTP